MQAREIGPDRVRIRLFQPGWPRPDLVHGALRAYVYARDAAAPGSH
jgi:hypothetical protein